MGDDMKQCLDKGRFDRFDKFDKFDKFDRDCCDCRSDDDDCRGRDDDWGLGDWLPIIIIVFLLFGGTNIFGGGSRDGCGDDGFGGSWLLIILVVFLLLGNQKDGKGFLGGLFG